jgi:hypothetical protein
MFSEPYFGFRLTYDATTFTRMVFSTATLRIMTFSRIAPSIISLGRMTQYNAIEQNYKHAECRQA